MTHQENTIRFDQVKPVKQRPIDIVPRTRNQERLVLALQDAVTLDDLQVAFKIGYKAAQAENDTMAMATLTNAKNKRKTALAAA